MTTVQRTATVGRPILLGSGTKVSIETAATPTIPLGFVYGGNVIKNPECREGLGGWQPFEILAGTALGAQTLVAGRLPQRRPYRLQHAMLLSDNSSIIQSAAWTCPDPATGANRFATVGGLVFAEHHQDVANGATLNVYLACAKNPSGAESPYSADNGVTVIRTLLDTTTFTTQTDHPRFGTGLTAVSSAEFVLPETCAGLPWMAVIVSATGGTAFARNLYQQMMWLRPVIVRP